MGTVLVLLALGGISVIRSQRSFLVEQVDSQLAAAMPFAGRPIQPGPIGQAPTRVPAPDAPISRLFVGVITGGELVPLLQGQLLDDSPQAGAVTELLLSNDGPLTVDGTNGTRFRIRASRLDRTEEYLVVALPLDEVDSAIGRLELVLIIVGALVTIAIGAAVWWVERLGIQPISRVTEAAEAISAGDRSQRVQGTDPRTEAGKLANAFNIMLDDRDAIERDRRQFVADASHELRTPLTSVRGYLDLYAQGRFSNSDEVDDMIRRMTRETSRMKDLVEELLLLANLDQQRPLREDDVDVNRLLNDAASDALAVQPWRSIVVDVPDSTIELVGDQFRLQQVIGALVDNALTHTEGDARIRLAVRLTSDGVEIVVADNGPGLEPETATRVFDRFFRGDDSRSRRSGNSGLGLAIAQSIVEAHGGTIALETDPGAGCTFTIKLPPSSPKPV